MWKEFSGFGYIPLQFDQCLNSQLKMESIKLFCETGPGGDCGGDNAGFGKRQVRDQHNFG